MYDYIGTSGDQVKCFYVPYIVVSELNEENGEKKVSFGISGGCLNGYNYEVPYQSRYYNYGKNFVIIDDTSGPLEDVNVHYIFNGKYVDTYALDDIPLTFEWPETVIDSDGNKMNISSVNELYEFVAEKKIQHIKYKTKQAQELRNAGYITLDSIQHYRNMDRELRVKEMNERRRIKMESYDLTIKPFRERWYNTYDRDDQIVVIGYILSEYERDKNSKTEDEWKVICLAAKNNLRNMSDDPLSTYCDWCEKNGIFVDRKEVYEWLGKYFQ